MPTRIKGTDTSAVDAGATRTVEAVRRTAPVASATTAATTQPDSVSITRAARSLAALQDVIAQVPAMDAGRVAHLSQVIDQGQYVADPARIADRLLQLERDLATAGQH